MKKFWKYLFLLLSTSSMSQNLVPNPSFEDTVICPIGLGRIQDAVGWYHAGDSPDYFNPCANASGASNGVPINFTGNQFAYDGNSYAGLVTSTIHLPQTYREYIGVQLTQSLTIGTQYHASAYISRGDSIFGGDTIKCSTSKFGFRFSTVSLNNAAPTDNFSHVHSDSIITDAIGWTKISGSFIADSAYQYLVIGNFYDDAHTDTAQCPGIAYYLVDMVCVSTNPLTCDVSTGIDEDNEFSLPPYPNPVNDQLYMLLTTGIKYYSIANMSGKIIMQGELKNQSATVNTSAISNGVYLLRLNNSKSYKIIIIHNN